MLLARCRHEGVDAAFHNRLHDSATPCKGEPSVVLLLEELEWLTEPGDMPRGIAACQSALKLVNRNKQPEIWARLQGQLGISYYLDPSGDRDRAENIEKAIHHYEQALTVRTHNDFPVGWAETQNSLGEAYRRRIRKERAENIEEAIHHCQHALEVRTPITLPQECRNTAYALGNLLYDERRFGEARE